MIDKFNFYDVYGYFLPGLALIGVLWLPFGLIARALPTAEWGSAIATVALAYFLGHLMLYVSTNLVPSYDVKKSIPGKERNPSETVLDADSSQLPKEIREMIAKAVSRAFQLEMHIESSTDEYDGARKTAFSLARQQLIHDKAASYAEQFQGMYSLARGLVVAFAISVAYYLGWVLSTLRWQRLVVGANVLVFVCLFLAINIAILLWSEQDHEGQRKEERKSLPAQKQESLRQEDRKRKRILEQVFAGVFLLAFTASGYVLASGYDIDRKTTMWLALSAVVASIALVRCYLQ